MVLQKPAPIMNRYRTKAIRKRNISCGSIKRISCGMSDDGYELNDIDLCSLDEFGQTGLLDTKGIKNLQQLHGICRLMGFVTSGRE